MRRKKGPWSDIDMNRWKEYEDILTDSLWLFDSRVRGDGHGLDYHGNYIPQIATQVLTRYSKRGEIVLDLFLGSGTTAIEAVRMDRRCIGVELNPDLVGQVRGKLEKLGARDRVCILQGDSTRPETGGRVAGVLKEMGSDFAHLLILHPPYENIIKFSDNPDDLSNAKCTSDYLDRFELAARRGYELLAPGRFGVLVIGDKYKRGELIPLGWLCMERMIEAGFRIKGLVVKNIEGNEIGKGKGENLWRYRALRGGFFVFKHEYVIVFFKAKAGRPKYYRDRGR